MTSLAREILDRLVGFPTVSSASNLDLVDWVEAFFAGHGIRAHRAPNEDGTKAAVFAQVGPDVEGGIVLSGHTDVVPVEGQDWSHDPWSVTESDGRLYGRGTCDMKGFDALAIAALVRAKDRPLKRPLQIALSYDEEIGCTGATPLIAAMDGVLPRAGIAIIGEPSLGQVVTGHKGSAGFEVHVRGFEVHSSIMHRGVNAIMEAARLIDWANRMNAENRSREPAPLDAIFEPPWTTVHVGTIRGGTAHNITAKDCHFDLDFRCVPGDDPEDWKARFLAEVARVEQDMRAIHPEARIEAREYFGVPALRTENDGAAERLARALTGDNGTHVVSYGTEAGHFQNARYSAVICGPGDIAQAHQPDEYLAIAEFEKAGRFLDRLIDHLCAD